MRVHTERGRGGGRCSLTGEGVRPGAGFESIPRARVAVEGRDRIRSNYSSPTPGLAHGS